ncbi:alkyl hydroperoxide reductase [Flavivirga aquatica]|uniref:thioredoxin-dependent peroxiredoxin n=1 Tax=Flavivirga aquatica TaxID=1849968 RepID=A0A1E5TC31_9FLAO|nr:peroxiredoxin-like family protein [Flavivirga aquatica]OEK08943.1 alkyl hydroperoxide reductase [Flavivirga aquatica]
MNLSQILSEKKAGAAQNIPAEKWAIMENSTNILKEAKLSLNAVKTGDILPVFNLPNANNTNIKLEDFNNEYLVISFYRGGWCPYCNIELRALQNILPELKKLNAELIAISPETPDNSLTTTEKNELSFNVLSDIDNKYAKSLGLVFQMPEDLRALYHSFNLNVDAHNGNKDYELPMPATYIINRQKEIIYSFVPEDYTERLEPEVVLEIIKKQSISA